MILYRGLQNSREEPLHYRFPFRSSATRFCFHPFSLSRSLSLKLSHSLCFSEAATPRLARHWNCKCALWIFPYRGVKSICMYNRVYNRDARSRVHPRSGGWEVETREKGALLRRERTRESRESLCRGEMSVYTLTLSTIASLWDVSCGMRRTIQ